jgi:hypothetical protein
MLSVIIQITDDLYTGKDLERNGYNVIYVGCYSGV